MFIYYSCLLFSILILVLVLNYFKHLVAKKYYFLAFQKISAKDLSKENVERYLAFKPTRQIGGVVKDVVKNSPVQISAKQLYMLVVLAKPYKIDLSNLIDENKVIHNYEHNEYFAVATNHSSMQSRILSWLQSVISEQDSVNNLLRTMPYIDECYSKELRPYLKHTVWRQKSQLILDKLNLFDVGQYYFENIYNEIDDLELYYQIDKTKFATRISKLGLEKIKQLISINVGLYGCITYIFRTMAHENYELNGLYIWYKLSYTSNYEQACILLRENYLLFSEIGIKIEDIDLLGFKYALTCFASSIVPFLNGAVSKLDLVKFKRVFGLLPSEISNKIRAFFLYLNPGYKYYSHAWKIFLKEKITGKHGIYFNLDFFIKFYGLWPELSEQNLSRPSSKDFAKIWPLVEYFNEKYLDSISVQLLINNLDSWLNDPRVKIDLNNSSSAVMQEVACSYLGFIQQYIGDDYVLKHCQRM